MRPRPGVRFGAPCSHLPQKRNVRALMHRRPSATLGAPPGRVWASTTYRRRHGCPRGNSGGDRAGLVCKSDGWFVVNAREVRWYESEGWGKFSNFGGDTLFDQLGFGVTVLGAGQPLSMYHWESDQEDFLILSGTANLIVEAKSGRSSCGTSSTALHTPNTRSSAVRASCSASAPGSATPRSGPTGAATGARAKASTPSTKRR